jgi:hypothetical protein
MYRASVPVFVRALGNCAAFLRKAAAEARERGLADAELLEARLHPDMFGLGRQVQIAVDGANGAAARLAGIDPAEPEDPAYAVFNRGSDAGFGPEARKLDELIARVEAGIATLGTYPEAGFAGAETRTVIVAMYGSTRIFTGETFLLAYVLPNLFFHVGMAYAILRQRGFALGKQDYEGPPSYASGVPGA